MDVRLSNIYSTYGVQPARNNAVGAKRPEQTKGESDIVSISAQAEDYQTARRAVAAVPDIREDVVNHLRDMIEQGNYKVSAQDVAARIFRAIG